MSVGFDAATEFPTTQSAGVSNTLTLSWNHIPVTSTPRGVGLFVTYAPSSLTLVTAVQYGGVDLTRRELSRDTATEPGVTEFWYLGAGVPTGTQAFNVVRLTGTAGMWGVGFTVSASFSTTVPQTILVQENTSLNEKTLSTIQVGVRFAAAYYGGAAPPGVGANSTTLFDIDYGAYAARVVRETTAGSGKRVVGFSAGTADDIAAIYVAIDEELQPGPATTVSLSSKVSDLAFGIPSVILEQRISPSSLASTEGFGTLTIQPGKTAVYPSSFDGSLSSTFNQGSGFLVWQNQVTVTYTVTATVPTGYKFTELASPDISATANIGYNYSPPLVSGDLVVYRQWTTANGITTSHSVTISPTGFITIDGGPSDSYSLSFIYFFWDDSANAYGSTLTYTMQTMGAGAQTAYPVGKASDEAFGQASLSSRTIVYPVGKDSDASFGTASLTSRFIVYPLSKDTDAAFGQASLSTKVTVFPTGKETDAAFGTANVSNFFYITPTGKVSDAAFGQASLSQITTIYPVGKSSDADFGVPALGLGNYINPISLDSNAAFGVPALSSRTFIYPSGLDSDTAFGQYEFGTTAFVYPTSYVQVETFGIPSIGNRNTFYPSSLASDFAAGEFILNYDQTVYLNGIYQTEFGQFRIYVAGQLIVAGNNIFQWFDAQPDLKGSRIDRLRQYLQALGYEGQTNEILFSWLGSLGYTETMAERIYKFEREYTNRYGPF